MYALENDKLIEIPDEENTEDLIKCQWCHELFCESKVKKEVKLGYLCNRCIDAIWSRGEKLCLEV